MMRKLCVWMFVLLVSLASLPLAAQRIRIGRSREPKPVAQPVTVDPNLPAEPVTLESVNRRWGGARCQFRVPVDIEKGKVEDNWWGSKWLLAPTLPGDRKIEIRLLVSDRDSLERGGYLIRKKTLRAGMFLVSQGWSFREPKKGKGLLLQLRFDNLPIQAILEFKDSKLDALEDAERLARIELFSMLPAAPPASVQAAPAANPQTAGNPAPPSPALPASPSVYEPAVQILGCSVNPAQARRSGAVELVIHYLVSGLPPGASFIAVETRRIVADGKELISFEEKVARQTGEFTARQRIQIPANMAPGIYTLQVTVAVAGQSAESTALFEVR